jgi:hypothetical protein
MKNTDVLLSAFRSIDKYWCIIIAKLISFFIEIDLFFIEIFYSKKNTRFWTFFSIHLKTIYSLHIKKIHKSETAKIFQDELKITSSAENGMLKMGFR